MHDGVAGASLGRRHCHGGPERGDGVVGERLECGGDLVEVGGAQLAPPRFGDVVEVSPRQDGLAPVEQVGPPLADLVRPVRGALR